MSKKTKKDPQSYIVLVGNVVNGLAIYGPFDDPEDADDWALDELRDTNWVVAEVVPPPRT